MYYFSNCDLIFIFYWIDIHAALPIPDFKAIPNKDGRFLLKVNKKVVHRGDRDIRVVMVIKIKDEITNNTYYEWQARLFFVNFLFYEH